MPIITIEDLIRYRRVREKLVYRIAEADLPPSMVVPDHRLWSAV